MQLIAHLLLLLGGVGVLYYGAEWLVRGSARLASSMGIPPIVVGLTIVSMGTSAPELVVSLMAALDGNPDLALGNVMGSNLANIGLVLGLTSVIRPLSVNARVRRDVPLMLLVTLALLPLAWDQHLGRADGALLIFLLGLYLVFVFRTSGGEAPALLEEVEEFLEAEELEAGRPRLRDLGLMIVGCTSLVLAGSAIVRSGVFLATEMGISQLVIGLTAIAVGTSLPELATTLVAVLRLETDLAVGNVIGSNIFNVGAILGITAAVTPLPVPAIVLSEELPAVLLLSLVVWPVTRTGFRVQRWEGAFLLGLYLALTTWLVWPAPPGTS